MTLFPLIFALALVPPQVLHQLHTNLVSAEYSVNFWCAFPTAPGWTELQTNSPWSDPVYFTNVLGGTNVPPNSVSFGWSRGQYQKSPAETYNVGWTYAGRSNFVAGLTDTNYVLVLNPPVTNGVAFFIQESTNLLTWSASPTFPGVLRITNGTAGQRFVRAAWTNWSL